VAYLDIADRSCGRLWINQLDKVAAKVGLHRPNGLLPGLLTSIPHAP
jgi:hypothetical protein